MLFFTSVLKRTNFLLANVLILITFIWVLLLSPVFTVLVVVLSLRSPLSECQRTSNFIITYNSIILTANFLCWVKKKLIRLNFVILAHIFKPSSTTFQTKTASLLQQSQSVPLIWKQVTDSKKNICFCFMGKLINVTGGNSHRSSWPIDRPTAINYWLYWTSKVLHFWAPGWLSGWADDHVCRTAVWMAQVRVPTCRYLPCVFHCPSPPTFLGGFIWQYRVESTLYCQIKP